MEKNVQRLHILFTQYTQSTILKNPATQSTFVKINECTLPSNYCTFCRFEQMDNDVCLLLQYYKE